MAKRHGNLFEKIVAHENLFEAYKRARKGKSKARNVREFERDVNGNLEEIRNSLITQTFSTSRYQVKKIFEPKERDIFVLPFKPDRIVQHAAMRILEPVWDGLFIDDSYACRKGRGIHAGSKRTMEFVRKYKYCLKCDISKFYPSIDHHILFEIVQRKIKCRETLWLLGNIIYSVPGEKNVPIGNLTSQWFGNLYMNELDQKAKHAWKVKGYLRYCDDFCFFHNDKAVLRNLALEVADFLCHSLKLTLSKCDLFPVAHGVDFLGYRHFKEYILLRKSTAKRVRRRLARLPYLLSEGKITMEQFRSSVASTRGWLMWANSKNLTVALNLENLMRKAGCR